MRGEARGLRGWTLIASSALVVACGAFAGAGSGDDDGSGAKSDAGGDANGAINMTGLDAGPASGCDADVLSDSMNCGHCGVVCAAPLACDEGACMPRVVAKGGAPTTLRVGDRGVYWLDGETVRGVALDDVDAGAPYQWAPQATPLLGLGVVNGRVFTTTAIGLFSAADSFGGGALTPVNVFMTPLVGIAVAQENIVGPRMYLTDGKGTVYTCDGSGVCNGGALPYFDMTDSLMDVSVIAGTLSRIVVAGTGNLIPHVCFEDEDGDGGLSINACTTSPNTTVNDLAIAVTGVYEQAVIASSTGVGSSTNGNSGGWEIFQSDPAFVVAVDPNALNFVYVGFANRVDRFDMTPAMPTATPIATGLKHVAGIGVSSDTVYFTDSTLGRVFRQPK